MRLADLNPHFLDEAGADLREKFGLAADEVNEALQTISGTPRPDMRRGVGLMCDCPCGCDRPLYVPFRNPLDGLGAVEGQGWERTGETFDTITLTPSVNRTGHTDSCGWHGYITDGHVRSV